MPEPVVVTPGVLRGWRLPEPGSGKYARGTVLVVGGSRVTPGAVILAAESALRVGAGKLRVVTADSVAAPVSLALPEALVRGLPEGGSGDISAKACEEVVALAESADAVLLGPGLVDPGSAVELLRGVVPALDVPVVVDALGSAYVTEHPGGLRSLEGRCVVTANPNELAHMTGSDEDSVAADMTAATRATAEATGAVVLCGGTQKCIATPDGQAWLVQEGGVGLGVSGSGDVQAGFVAGLLARGAEPAQAAVWGGYLHGRAGDRLAETVGPVGFLARELPAVAPQLLASLAR